jgi:hypothetical protein
VSATTTQLLSSGEFCILRYDTIPVKSASANVSFYTSNSKMPNTDTRVVNERYIITPENHKEGTWYKREDLHPTDGM